jgi:hypothetical protein
MKLEAKCQACGQKTLVDLDNAVVGLKIDDSSVSGIIGVKCAHCQSAKKTVIKFEANLNNLALFRNI